MSAKRTTKDVEDPLLRACTACDAAVGEGCRALPGNDNRRPYGSRLVHAVRLEEDARG